MDRSLQIIGLAKKAGLLAVGTADTGAAARTGKVRLVISANDASSNAVRKACNAAQTCSVPHIIVPYTSFELGNVSKRGSPGTIAFLDIGLASSFMNSMSEAEPERFKEPTGLLAQQAREHAKKKKTTPPVKRRTMQ